MTLLLMELKGLKKTPKFQLGLRKQTEEAQQNGHKSKH